MATGEQVILVNDSGLAIGDAPKSTIHHRFTPLHLAFSCYVVDRFGDLLLTKRSAQKLTWPHVWTNSCCGHPRPGEQITSAIRRRLRHELGIGAGRIDVLLPRFRYRATMDNGIVENELCPVFRATMDSAGFLRGNPDEVAETCWTSWPELVAMIANQTVAVAPWCRYQVDELGRFGDDPLGWPAGDPADLPSAAMR